MPLAVRFFYRLISFNLEREASVSLFYNLIFILKGTMDYSDRTYATALTATIGNVDFAQVMETSAATVRKSIDETEFVLKWYTAQTPSFITDDSVTLTWSGSHADCLTLMASAEWTSDEEI